MHLQSIFMIKLSHLGAIKEIWLGIVIALGLAGCVPPPDFPAESVCEQAQYTGLYVLNEGRWGANIATLDVWDEATWTACADVTRQRLGGPLGDVAHSFFRDADTLFLVLNGSGQVQKWLLPELKLLSTLQMRPPFSPRHLARVSGHKALLTSLYGDSLAIFDPTTMTLTRKIQVAEHQEGIVCVGETAFVAVGAFPTDPAGRVALINTSTDAVLGYVKLPVRNPGRMIAWRGGVWLYCTGDYNPQGDGSAVIELSPITGKIENKYSFSGSIFGIEQTGNQLLVLRDSAIGVVYPASGEVEPLWRSRFQLTGNHTDILYGMSFDAEKSLLYICNARDYVTPGEVVVLNPLGEVQRRLPAASVPKWVLPVR